MSVEDLLKGLKPEDAKAIQDWHDADVAAEKERGITESRNKGSEVKKHMTAANKYRDFLRTRLEFDPDGDLEQQLKDAEEEMNRSSKGKKNSEVEAIRTEFNRKFEVLRKEKEDAQHSAKVSTITSILQEQMKDIHGAPFIIKDFINSGKVDLDGDQVIFVDNDDRFDMATGLDNFKKANPNLVAIQQRPGAGSTAGVRSTPGAKQMLLSEWKKLGGKEQAAFINSGGTCYE